MKIDKKELKARIKNEKATLKGLKGDARNSAKLAAADERKVNAQDKLVTRLENKLALAK